jgi:hypothetical protein
MTLLAALAIGASACIANRIRVEAADAAIVGASSTLHVSLGKATPGALSVPATLSSALLTKAESALRAKGYAIRTARDSELVVELAVRKERVSRRTYTADSDANGSRMVERTEAVLSLRAVETADGSEVWRCDARGRLPEPELARLQSDEALFDELLARALEKIPARS